MQRKGRPPREVNGWRRQQSSITAPGGLQQCFNKAYAAPGIQHGTITDGLTNQAVIRKLGQYDAATNTYRTPERIVNMFTGQDGVVHVFQKTEGQVGFVRTMPMLEYLKQYNLEAYHALEQALPPEIWRLIRQGG